MYNMILLAIIAVLLAAWVFTGVYVAVKGDWFMRVLYVLALVSMLVVFPYESFVDVIVSLF